MALAILFMLSVQKCTKDYFRLSDMNTGHRSGIIPSAGKVIIDRTIGMKCLQSKYCPRTTRVKPNTLVNTHCDGRYKYRPNIFC